MRLPSYIKTNNGNNLRREWIGRSQIKRHVQWSICWNGSEWHKF